MAARQLYHEEKLEYDRQLRMVSQGPAFYDHDDLPELGIKAYLGVFLFPSVSKLKMEGDDDVAKAKNWRRPLGNVDANNSPSKRARTPKGVELDSAYVVDYVDIEIDV